MIKDYSMKYPKEYIELIELVDYDLVDLSLLSKKIGFYDTCSIQYHSSFTEPKLMADYFKDRFDLLIITQTVMMELSTQTSVVSKIVDYIKTLIEEGMKVVCIAEEDIRECILDEFAWTNEEINTKLLYAIRSVANVPILKKAFDADEEIKKSYLFKPNKSDNYFKDFFEWIRSKKELKDGLGECLMMIVNHVICSPIQETRAKRVIISDDRQMYYTMSKVRQNILQHYGIQEPKLMTTPSIMSFMYRNKLCLEREKLRELGLCTKHSVEDMFNFTLIEESANVPIDKRGNIESLLDAIYDREVIRVLF